MRLCIPPVAAALAALSIAAVLCAQEVPLTREGAYWVRASQSTLNLPVQPRLQVVTRGSIVLRGGPGNQVTYRLKQKVRARSEEDARRLIGSAITSLRSAGDLTRFIVMPASSPLVITELEVNVPRQLTAALLETQWGGGIEAYDLDGSVQAVTPAGMIQLDRIRGNVIGRTGGGEIRLGKIGGAVRCASGAGSVYLESAGADANCATAGGNIVVTEAGGPLVLSTEGGNIRVDKATASVEAHSAEGVIEVGQAGGIVTADTHGGSIQVGSARGVKAESALGTVRVKSAAAPMSVAAAAGNILAELLAGTRMEESSLVAGAGDITVLIPSNLAVSVMARNDSGGTPRIVSDFPEIRANATGFFRPPLVAQGAINGGGPVLRLNASGGVIYLRRVK
jgi:DUF4097 and DUF4098 domain-containing protein YvlB